LEISRANRCDSLTFTVQLSGPYPSVNNLGADGRRNGRKSASYKEHFRNVRSAAWAAMSDASWETATWYVELTMVRLVPDRRVFDQSNLGKCDADALAPSRPNDPGPVGFPGRYINDRLAIVRPFVEFDPIGPDRIIYLARRTYPLALAFEPSASVSTAKARPRRKPASSREVSPGSCEVSTERLANFGGQPISRDEALALIFGKARPPAASGVTDGRARVRRK